MGLQEAERGGGLQAMNQGGEMLLPSRAVSWRQTPPEYGFCQRNNKVKKAKKDNIPEHPGSSCISKCPLVTLKGRNPRLQGKVYELPDKILKIQCTCTFL